MTDVIIAGAGPAGTIAALVLAQAGVRVTLFDRASFPRHKLCGDTVNPGARAVLRRLGLDHVTAGGLSVKGMVVSGERGVRVIGAYEGECSGVAISRRVLDERLLTAAAAAGVEVQQGVLAQAPLRSDDGRAVTGLEIVGPSGRVDRQTARVTIAADGRSSRIARATDLSATPRWPRRWAFGAIFSGVNGLSAFGEMHVRDRRYLGIAPLPGGYANGCVVTGDRAALRDPDLLMTTIRDDAEIAGRFARARRVSDVAVLGPLAVDVRAAGMPGLLLAGDAAGFIDPMTGDGLRFAFRGGELAALEALRVLDGGWRDAHLRLDVARRSEFAAKWRFNRALRALAASPAAVRAAGVSAALLPPLLRRVIQYAGDVHLT
ncbi:MAG: NAD(P)/FAD-dependent oxidoreductase [Acidobacteria bacterium]|nr:NAD(P)/FAD-dependent oxidoreductase [Acidobacteriota bacterium]